MSRILVIGRSGQLARALDLALGADGHDVVRWGRSHLDLSDPNGAATKVAEESFDVVINAGAYTDVDGAQDDRETAMTINCDGPAAVASAASAGGAGFIHVSTDYVFDGSKGAPYRETDAPNPLNIYGESKRAGEVAVLEAHQGAIILRTSWLFSPSGRNFLTTMARLASGSGPLRVVDDQTGQPTAAADLARAIAVIAKAPGAGKEPSQAGLFHAAGADSATWCDFAAGIMTGLEARGAFVRSVTPISTSEYPTRASRPADSRLDCTRLKQVFGISIPGWTASLPEILDQYLQYEGRSVQK